MALETAEALYDQVVEDTNDHSLEFEDCVKIFNRGLRWISGRVLLPALETSSDLYVGTATITATTISFTASSSTISDSGSALITSGFHVGQTITITGASESQNNQTTTISSMASDGSSMVVAGTLADEAAGESITIVNDGPNNVPLPSTFHRNLFYCYSASHYREVDVYGSRVLMQTRLGRLDLAGRVVGVAGYGSNLYYQRIPSTAEQLQISYYQKPTGLSAKTDTPSCLPEEYASDLMIYWADWKIWEGIEQDVSGDKVNTKEYKDNFFRVFAELELDYGAEDKKPPEITDVINYGDFL